MTVLEHEDFLKEHYDVDSKECFCFIIISKKDVLARKKLLEDPADGDNKVTLTDENINSILNELERTYDPDCGFEPETIDELIYEFGEVN